MEEVNVLVSTVCVVQIREWSQASEQRPGVLAERVKVQAVKACG
jgi:hypothetical protein